MKNADWIIGEFLTESREHLDQLEHSLVELEKNPISSELIADVFRTTHTIKGTCVFLGFSRLEALAHAEETLLSQVRRGQQRLSSAIVSLLLCALDRIRAILSEVESTGNEGDGEDSDLIKRLAEQTIPPPLLDLPSEEAHKPLGQLLVETGGVSPGAIVAALGAQKEGDTRPIGEILVDQGAASASLIRNFVECQMETRAQRTADTSVRIEFTTLSDLAYQSRELQNVRDQLLHFGGPDPNDIRSEAIRDLDRISDAIETLVLSSLMQPLSTIWMRFPRLVRDLASAQGKQARLEMEGHNLQADRRVLEAIKDPLVHLIRNSIDHGIESPGERRAAKKPIEGRITLRGFRKAAQLIVEVEDDGGGIDVDRLRAKALEMGFITECQARDMNDEELTNLVFLPGLSTVQRVTRLSGRGVGMDIVRTNIEKVGGTVLLENHRMYGLKVMITLPLPSSVPANVSCV